MSRETKRMMMHCGGTQESWSRVKKKGWPLIDGQPPGLKTDFLIYLKNETEYNGTNIFPDEDTS
jgi:hypothetical protein